MESGQVVFTVPAETAGLYFTLSAETAGLYFTLPAETAGLYRSAVSAESQRLPNPRWPLPQTEREITSPACPWCSARPSCAGRLRPPSAARGR